MKHLLKCAYVLEKTKNMVISLCCFPEDKEIYQNVKHVQGNYIGLLLVSLIDPIVLRVLDAIAILIAEASLY